MLKKEKKKEDFKQKNTHGKLWQGKPLKSIKVALVYDRVNKFGGAERVLLSLHNIFPRAPLYTSVYQPKKAKWAKVFNVKTSFLQKIPFAKNHHQLFSPFMHFAFKSFSLEKYDVVISVTSEFAKAIQVTNGAKHICICLTPTRYLWSGYEEYFPNKIFRSAMFPLTAWLRFLDKRSAENPDEFIAISKEVQKRIIKYYGRNSEVIYPASTMKIDKGKTRIKDKKNGYFLVVSRLSRFTLYKRVDIAIKAATKLELPLVVIGQGNQKYFQKYAGPTIKFISNVTDKELWDYYKGANALIFPGNEDFGLAMVEAQAAGIPVIAYKGGGALEIVKEGETGEFFRKQTVKSLMNVLEKFDKSRYNSQSCRKNAERFSFAYFQKSLKEYILKVIAKGISNSKLQ